MTKIDIFLFNLNTINANIFLITDTITEYYSDRLTQVFYRLESSVKCIYLKSY